MRKISKALAALGVAALAVTGVAVGLSGSAHNADGTAVAFGHSTSKVVQNPDGSHDVIVDTSTQTVDLTGETSLVATGTTSRSRVLGGQGVWNMKIWWDDSPAGSAYTTYQTSFFNPGNHYSGITFRMWGPNGAYRYKGMLPAGDIYYETDDFTGSSTTKAESDAAYLVSSPGDLMNPSGCIYLTPSATNETGTDCSV